MCNFYVAMIGRYIDMIWHVLRCVLGYSTLTLRCSYQVDNAARVHKVKLERLKSIYSYGPLLPTPHGVRDCYLFGLQILWCICMTDTNEKPSDVLSRFTITQGYGSFYNSCPYAGMRNDQQIIPTAMKSFLTYKIWNVMQCVWLSR